MFRVVCKTSKWTFTSQNENALAALEGIIPQVAAAEQCSNEDAGELLSTLKMSGKLDETVYLNDVMVDVADYV